MIKTLSVYIGNELQKTYDNVESVSCTYWHSILIVSITLKDGSRIKYRGTNVSVVERY